MTQPYHYYRVGFYLSPEATGRRSGSTMCVGLVAVDLAHALSETKRMYPLARVDSINRQGAVANLPGGLEDAASLFCSTALPTETSGDTA